jgi:hypothetical protein
VSARLWVRNGGSALDQALNYSAPPLCRSLRDLDLVALQWACTAVGADVFMQTLLEVSVYYYTIHYRYVGLCVLRC